MDGKLRGVDKKDKKGNLVGFQYLHDMRCNTPWFMKDKTALQDFRSISQYKQPDKVNNKRTFDEATFPGVCLVWSLTASAIVLQYIL